MHWYRNVSVHGALLFWGQIGDGIFLYMKMTIYRDNTWRMVVFLFDALEWVICDFLSDRIHSDKFKKSLIFVVIKGFLWYIDSE